MIVVMVYNIRILDILEGALRGMEQDGKELSGRVQKNTAPVLLAPCLMFDWDEPELEFPPLLPLRTTGAAFWSAEKAREVTRELVKEDIVQVDMIMCGEGRRYVG